MCCYKSPDSSQGNNNGFLLVLEQIDDLSPTDLSVVGVFNYGCIDWHSGITPGTSNGDDQRLTDKIRDLFWYQRVDKPTRIRGHDTPHILDLIITNEENMVEKISYDSPMGLIDHCVLVFDYICYAKSRSCTKKKYILHKAVFAQMRNSLRINWRQPLQGKPLDEQLYLMHRKLSSAQEQCIPTRTISSSSGKTWKIPLEPNYVREIKKKHRCWTRYIETMDPTKLKEYRRQRNKVRTLTHKGTLHFEKSIAESIKP